MSAAIREGAELGAKEGIQQGVKEAAEQAAKRAADLAQETIELNAKRAAVQSAQESLEAATRRAASEGGSQALREQAEARLKRVTTEYENALKAADPNIRLAADDFAKSIRTSVDDIAKETKIPRENIIANIGDEAKLASDAKAVANDSLTNNVFTRNRKLALIGLSVAGFALYCVFSGSSPSDALANLAGDLTETGVKVLEAIADKLGLKDAFLTIWTYLKWVAIGVFFLIGLILIYKIYTLIAPSGKQEQPPVNYMSPYPYQQPLYPYPQQQLMR